MILDEQQNAEQQHFERILAHFKKITYHSASEYNLVSSRNAFRHDVDQWPVGDHFEFNDYIVSTDVYDLSKSNLENIVCSMKGYSEDREKEKEYHFISEYALYYPQKFVNATCVDTITLGGLVSHIKAKEKTPTHLVLTEKKYFGSTQYGVYYDYLIADVYKL